MSFDIVLVGNSRTLRFVKKNWSSFYQRIQTNNDQLLWKEQDFVKRKTFSQVQVSTDIILVGRIKFWLKSGCKKSSQAMFACHPLHRLVHYCIIPLLTFLQYPPQFFLHLLEFCSSHCCMQLRASHWLCALCRPEPVHQMRDKKKVDQMYCIGYNWQKRNEVKKDNVDIIKMEHNWYLVHPSLKYANILLPADSDGPALRLWVDALWWIPQTWKLQGILFKFWLWLAKYFFNMYQMSWIFTQATS